MIELSDVERMYLRNFLRDGERHLNAAQVMFDHEFHDFSVMEACESILWNLDSLLLTVKIRTSKNSTAIAWFGKKFVKEDVYPKEFYEDLLFTYSVSRIADSEFGGTITSDVAAKVLRIAKKFGEIVTYLRDFDTEPVRKPAEEVDEGKIEEE